jgi:hypothetical protein
MEDTAALFKLLLQYMPGTEKKHEISNDSRYAGQDLNP